MHFKTKFFSKVWSNAATSTLRFIYFKTSMNLALTLVPLDCIFERYFQPKDAMFNIFFNYLPKRCKLSIVFYFFQQSKSEYHNMK